MLIRSEAYEMSTLCKFDSNAIEKVKDQFNNIVRRIFEERKELICQVFVDYLGHTSKHNVYVAGNSVDFCRLMWSIKGECESLNIFFDTWRKMDNNPFRSFKVQPSYTLVDILKLMNIRENKD